MLLGISASIFVSDQDRTLRESIDRPIPAMATVFVPWVAPNSLPLIARQLPGGAEIGDTLVIRGAAHTGLAGLRSIIMLTSRACFIFRIVLAPSCTIPSSMP